MIGGGDEWQHDQFDETEIPDLPTEYDEEQYYQAQTFEEPDEQYYEDENQRYYDATQDALLADLNVPPQSTSDATTEEDFYFQDYDDSNYHRPSRRVRGNRLRQQQQAQVNEDYYYEQAFEEAEAHYPDSYDYEHYYEDDYWE